MREGAIVAIVVVTATTDIRGYAICGVARHAGAFPEFQLYCAPMGTLFWSTIRRSRPQVGWRQATLAFAFALCPALAATDTRMELPAGLFFWAGTLGLWLGMRAGQQARNE